MSLIRINSASALPKRYAAITVFTESRFKQAFMQNLIEELLRSYPEDISRWVVSSDDVKAEAFEAEFAKPSV